MAVYNVSMSLQDTVLSIKNNTDIDFRVWAYTETLNTEDYRLAAGNATTRDIKSTRQLVVYKPSSTESPGFFYTYFLQRFQPNQNIFTMSYIDGKGQANVVTKTQSDGFSLTNNSVSDTITPAGLTSLHIDDTRVEQINYGSKSYTSFPVDIPLDPNVKTMSVIGKTFNVQLDNELNIVRVKDGQTEYRQFPATIMVGENKTLQLYGKEDPEITIDYTGTQDPVISNTPATPPPVV